MSMQILNGKDVSAAVRLQLKKEIQSFISKGLRAPGLAVVLVGDDSASQVYVESKIKACHELGMLSYEFRLPKNTTTNEVQKILADCAKDERIDGILVQLPLPTTIDTKTVIESIPPSKDADCLTAANLGLLFKGLHTIAPCTPSGIMEILKFYGHSVSGKSVVVIGRSQIVGLPMAQLMIQEDATVTIVHSKTKNSEQYIKDADVVVVAAGKAKFLNKNNFKTSAIVIDVGIHRDQKNKLCGDVNTEGISVHAITPVPGGVGPMTIAMLLRNTFVLYKQRVEN